MGTAAHFRPPHASDFTARDFSERGANTALHGHHHRQCHCRVASVEQPRLQAAFCVFGSPIQALSRDLETSAFYRRGRLRLGCLGRRIIVLKRSTGVPM